MASHSRHVLSRPGEIRVQVKFRRHDLLWVHRGPLTNPYAAHPDAIGSVQKLPFLTDKGDLVGPTILDMLVRKLVPLTQLSQRLGKVIRKLGHAKGLKQIDAWPIWSVRDPDTLWCSPTLLREGISRNEAAAEKIPDHPFKPALTSGGAWTHADPKGWVEVAKYTTVSLSEQAYRLCVGMHGSVPAAYESIGAMAAAAWDADRDRALALWAMVNRVEDGLLPEDDDVEALRPSASVSQEVEREILRAACRWLGVDPDLDVHRPRGRPAAAAGDEGDVVRVRVEADGTVTGSFTRAFHGVVEGSLFSSLGIVTLAEILGALRQGGLETDADLLEAYLDAAADDWREQAAAADSQDRASVPDESPHDVLGILPGASQADIAAAFRAQMLAVQNLPNSAPARRLIAAFKLIKQREQQA